ncbi:hypothetical protein [Halorarum salinum]|uniref:Transcriptional initiation protein Tat n=1 Tax=Halorarum salinum TaxID=2743089 RepID=A0A7D5LB68_9EURY|nr:hypothetical protein [Halobaculum salinum]QLG62371.1 hypothetical protein HUG12_11775 [Halobaculum salinum]
MKRRGVLVGLAGLVAGAGCTDVTRPSGPRTPPPSPEPTSASPEGLVIAELVDEEGDDGSLVVRVTVENRTGEARTGTVVAEASAGGEGTTVSAEVTVEPGESEELSLATELDYGEFARDGSLRVDVE